MKNLRLFLFALCLGVVLPVLSFGQAIVAPFLNSRATFLNDSGDVAAGYCLFTFAAGTTNQLATYSDLGNTLNTDPIILDSTGSATIYLTASSYKFKLVNPSGANCSTGQTQWTQDGVTWATPLSTFSGIVDTADLTLQQLTAATSGANNSSGNIKVQGTYWTGSASATDQWNLQDIIGSGANPTSTLTFTHSGSTGASNVSLPVVNGILNAAAQTGSDIFAQANAAFTACSNKCTVYIPAGTYNSVQTALSYPVANNGTAALWCDAGATINIGTGIADAIQAFGSATANANVKIYGGCKINGSGASANTNGIHLKNFSTAHISDIQVLNFPGDGVQVDGANTIWLNGMVINGSGHHGVHCVGNVAAVQPCDGLNVAPNNEIGNSTLWGIYDDATNSGTAGANSGNNYSGVLEFNGTNGSGTSGSIFIQGGNNITVSNAFLEYGGGVFPTNNILVGDGSNTPQAVVISNNWSGTNGTNTINLVRATGVVISGNYESGTPTNFINRGANASKVNIGLGNKATAAGTVIAGSDGGDASVFIFGAQDGPTTTSFINGSGPTGAGYSFNSISGWGQDLAIRERSGGTNIVNWQNSGGTGKGSIDASGDYTVTGWESLAEIAAPSCAANVDFLWADSTAHRIKECDNNGSAVQVVHSGADISTSDTVTAIQGTSVSGTTGTSKVVFSVAPTITGTSTIGPIIESGNAPTCSFTVGGGSGPSCSINTGGTNSGGLVLLTTGTGSPGVSGTFTVSFTNNPFGSNAPSCTFMGDNSGGGSWNVRITFLANSSGISTSTANINWDNNSVNLSASTQYRVHYICFGH